MVEEKQRQQRPRNQNMMLENRKKLSVTGVNDVSRFSDANILLKTELGSMTIKGSNLRILKLDLENTIIDIEGTIDSLDYGGKAKSAKPGILSRK